MNCTHIATTRFKQLYTVYKKCTNKDLFLINTEFILKN